MIGLQNCINKMTELFDLNRYKKQIQFMRFFLVGYILNKMFKQMSERVFFLPVCIMLANPDQTAQTTANRLLNATRTLSRSN